MPQHPKATVHWALRSLETAIRNLGESPVERRVRSQFHQLLLAIERAAFRLDGEQGDLSDPHLTQVRAEER